MHAANLATELEIACVVIPLYPGLFSALGLLVAELRFEFLRGLSGRLDSIEGKRLEDGFAQLLAQAKTSLAQAGLDPHAASYQRLMDVHYVKQTTELTVGLPDNCTEPADLVAAVASQFHEEHQRIYGYRRPEEPIGLLNLRIRASAPGCELNLERLGEMFLKEAASPPPREGVREAYFGKKLGMRHTRILSRSALLKGDVEGPAVLEEFDTTVLIPPGWRAALDARANIVLRPA